MEENGGNMESSDSAEQQPLRSTSNGRDGFPRGSPKKKKRLPARFELAGDNHNWRSAESTPSSSPSPSPSSSFRRKFVLTMPGIIRPKQPRENKLKIFVIIMFFIIILMISLTYVHHQQILLRMQQASSNQRLRIAADSRFFHISNPEKQVIFFGQFGVEIPEDVNPHLCPIIVNPNTSVCLEWYKHARLSVSNSYSSKTDATECYDIHWEALKLDVSLQDCFYMGDAHWYGMGEVNPQKWPLELLTTELTEFQSANISTGRFGTVLDRYWLSSSGISVTVDPEVYLQISFDSFRRNMTCVRTPASYKSTHSILLPNLTYTICSSMDAYIAHQHISLDTKPKVIASKLLRYTLENIVWSTRQRYGDHINKTQLFSFADDLLAYDCPGIMIIERGWQDHEGDLQFGESKFQHPRDMIKVLHNKGFKVVLGIHPYISTRSNNFHKHIEDNWWIRDVTSRVPGLTSWDSLSSVAMVDFTNPQPSAWFENTLKSLQAKFNIDGYQFCGGEATSLPPYHTTTERLTGQEGYAILYNDVASRTGFMFSTCAGVQAHSTPGFIQLSPRVSTWELPLGLQSLLPAVMSAGLAGYPFVLTGPVGGTDTHGVPSRLPDKELFVRWMELAIFLPVLQFSILPSEYGAEVHSLAKAYINLRRTIVVPQLASSLPDATGSRMPLVRPIWWMSPNDTDAHGVNSQFLVGSKVMVAPILTPATKERDVYLPPGLWKDRDDVLHKGGKWLYNYPVDLGKVAYFQLVDSMF